MSQAFGAARFGDKETTYLILVLLVFLVETSQRRSRLDCVAEDMIDTYRDRADPM
jgi:hypothetical protein